MGKNVNYKGKSGKSKSGKGYKNDKSKDYNERSTNNSARGTVNMDAITSNDFSWYNKYPTITDTATRQPWFKVAGAEWDWSKVMDYEGSPDFRYREGVGIPGIMRLDFVPGPGISGDSADAANKAFQVIMANIYAQTNATELGFNAPALGMYLTSIASISNLIATAKKVLGMVDFWIPQNINFPKALIQSTGFKYEDLMANAPLYRTALNSLIVQFNQMNIPNFVDIYHRQYSLCHNVYIDEDTPHAQLYHFMPCGWYAYDSASGVAEFQNIDWSTMNTFQDLLDLIQRAINTWFQNADYYLINGTLLRAYKGQSTMKIPEVTAGDMINPVVDKWIMYQVMNADIIPYNNIARDTLNITEDRDKELLVWIPRTEMKNVGEGSAAADLKCSRTKMLRSFEAADAITNEANMEMTRFCVGVREYEYASGQQAGFSTMGTEFIVKVSVYGWIAGANRVVETSITSNYDIVEAGTAFTVDSFRYAYNIINAFSPFRYVPRIFVYTISGEIFQAGVLGDLTTYTTLDEEQLRALNDAALLSIWKPELPAFKG